LSDITNPLISNQTENDMSANTFKDTFVWICVRLLF